MFPVLADRLEESSKVIRLNESLLSEIAVHGPRHSSSG
jgi:hypothetical protein